MVTTPVNAAAHRSALSFPVYGRRRRRKYFYKFWIHNSSVNSAVTILSQKSLIRVRSHTYGLCLWTITRCLRLVMRTAATAVVTTEIAASKCKMFCTSILSSSKWSLAGRDFKRIMAYALNTIQWKHLQIAIVLCRNFRNIAFILRKTVMETQLETSVHILHVFRFG